jgi:outer membrane receptor protein involved in Fe transport
VPALPAAEDRWGVYANATFQWSDFSLTPGIRLDSHSITGEFVSPSIGATYLLDPSTLLRATISRGFSAPYLALISGGSVWEPVNPDLEPETIWSYQAGFETAALKYFRIKGSLFYHEVEENWEYDNSLFYWVNGGKIERRGLDMEIETLPFHHVSLLANYSYVIEDVAGMVTDNDDMYTANLVLSYDGPQGLRGQLAGHFINWNEIHENEIPDYDDSIWDMTVEQTVFADQGIVAAVFIAVHNLFDGKQYWDYEYPNPPRWLEGGFKVHYR